ncbi:MAG: hypothetical protein H6605_08065 [Flavobacteriales bacterium]|nr:hypothetical protein [Flavobacteriales bacterium]
MIRCYSAFCRNLIACIFILIGKLNFAQLNTYKIYEPRELIEDLNLLEKNLKEIHPDLYRVLDNKKFENEIFRIRTGIDSNRSYLSFLKLLAPLFTKIGCFNTQWGHSVEYLKFREENVLQSPFDIRICGSRFFASEFYATANGPIESCEILKINNEEVEHYLNKNFELLPCDGFNRTLPKRWLESFYPKHQSNFWSQDSMVKLEVKNNRQEIKNLEIHAIANRSINKMKVGDTSGRFMQFSLIDGVAYLKVPSFKNVKNEDVKIFLDECFSRIQINSIQHLILNLKGGGDRDYYAAKILFDFLKPGSVPFLESIDFGNKIEPERLYQKEVYNELKEKKDVLLGKNPPELNSFHGKVYLVSDGWVTHSKGILCSRLRNRPGTVFLGEESGQNVYGLNDLPVLIQLPNTGIRVWIPTTQLLADATALKNYYGVKVDHPLECTNDGELIPYVLRLIKD